MSSNTYEREGNVTYLVGKPAEDADPHVVALLEDLLAQARAGNIRSLVIGGFNKEEDSFFAIAGEEVPTAEIVYLLNCQLFDLLQGDIEYED